MRLINDDVDLMLIWIFVIFVRYIFKFLINSFFIDIFIWI